VLEVHDSVDVPEPETGLGVGDPQDKPVGTVLEIDIVPVKLFSPVRVIVEVAEDPTGTVMGDDALTVKSWKLNVAMAEWTIDPLLPLTVSR
jgi:hypothetical protein